MVHALETKEDRMIEFDHTTTHRFMRPNHFFAVVMLVLWLCHPVFGQTPSPSKKTIALLSDGQSEPLNHLTLRFQKALETLAEGEITPVFKKSDGARWQKENAAAALKTALGDPAVDLVFINGPLLAREALKTARKHKKPMVGLFNFDPGFVLPKRSAERRPLALTTIPGQIRTDLRTMAQLFKIRELTILADGFLLAQVHDLKQQLLDAARKQGFSATVKPTWETTGKTLDSLGKEVKAVYMTPTLVMPASERKNLIRKLNGKGCFVFSGTGVTDVQKGALAGQLPPMNERLARHAALNAMRFFSGMRLRNPIDPLKPKRRLQINETTAVAVQYHVTESLAEKAREVEPEPAKKSVIAALPEVDRIPFDHYLKKSSTPELTLPQAVERALKKNASLSVKGAAVEEDRQDRDRMLTELFPQVRGQVGYMRVDQNIAQRSFGMFPEDRSSAGIALQQLIFSDPVISRLRAANKGVDSALFREKSLRLDVAARTQELYMDSLAAAALYWIREYNLKLTQQNLQTARQRNAAGTAGPQEVYRWEAKEAHDRSLVIRSQSALQSAMVGLNRIMGEEQHRIWSFQNRRASQMQGAFNEKTFMSLVLNPVDFQALTTHVLDTALDTSPELKSIDSLIDATRILKGYYKRRFVVPEASMEFGYSHTLDQTFNNVPAVEQFSRLVPEDADNHWAFQVKLVWSLFEGGGKIVDVRKNRATLRKLESLHREASQIVEQRARNALIKASAARSDMDLAKMAAEAANKNYKVVRDGYAQGVATILDLLDAQRETMVQERQAILSEYRFLKAIVEVERSMNRIAALIPVAEQESWWMELKERLGRKG
jgi:outer membrane protein